MFWVSAGVVSIVASFGSYTPIYPFLRDHVPPFGFFRFPVKYIMAAAMAVAAGAATGWDALDAAWADRLDPLDPRRMTRARLLAIGFAATIAVVATAFALACLYVPAHLAGPLEAFAGRLGDRSATAADFILRTVPQGALSVISVSAMMTVLIPLCTMRRSTASVPCKWVLFAVVVGDLVIRAWGINPTFDAANVQEPAWLSYTSAHADARFYVGGKLDGTLLPMDRDSSRGFLNAPGLTGSAGRAALNIQAAGYPSGWHAREMLSYDLPVLWPQAFTKMTKRFGESDSGPRDRLLDRTGVRYRVLPQRRAGGRTPLMPIPQFYESYLFDWGEDVASRASVVPSAQLMRDLDTQIKTLFEEGWDYTSTVFVDRELLLDGQPGPPVQPFAQFVEDRSNHALVEAGAGAGGGYLVVLDSYSDDWSATLDGRPATIARANGLFRAVRLPAGVHRVEFSYRPRPLVWGTAVTLAALVMIAGMLLAG
jgi:hypothetical protein